MAHIQGKINRQIVVVVVVVVVVKFRLLSVCRGRADLIHIPTTETYSGSAPGLQIVPRQSEKIANCVYLAGAHK